MERLNKKTLSFPAKIYTKVFAALGMVLAVAGCGDKGGSASVPVVPPIYGSGCATCSGVMPQPVLLTTFQSEATDFYGNAVVVLKNMQVIVQSTGIQQNASGNNYNWYSGPIAVSGQLDVRKQLVDYDLNTGAQLTSCVVPVGVYPIQTYSVGQMLNASHNGTDISIPSLVSTVGNIELRVEAPSPMGFLENGTRLWATVSIVRVNGVTCSNQFHGEFL